MAKKRTRSAHKMHSERQIHAVGDIEKEDENLVRMNFEVSEDLRNAFKGKVARQGKKVKDVLADFMTEYVKNEK